MTCYICNSKMEYIRRPVPNKDGTLSVFYKCKKCRSRSEVIYDRRGREIGTIKLRGSDNKYDI